MRTYANLYPQIIDFENLFAAAQRAMKGKGRKASAAAFRHDLEHELVRLKTELATQTYAHGAHRQFMIHDPKPRLISAAPFRDRVVHHALCRIIEPLFERSFIYDTYACRLGKGSHRAVDRYQKFCRKNTYVLKCDVSRYFDSIDHEILLEMLQRKVTCPFTLWLVGEILGQGTPGNLYFPGDNLFTPGERRCGLPLGNLTSQFFGNLYLNGFDHFIKEELKCRFYIRYVDDFVIFCNSKPRLHATRRAIESYLTRLRLILHPKKTRIYKVNEGPLFLGYRIFPTHRRLDKRNVLAMRRRMKQMQQGYAQGRMTAGEIQQRIRSWIGHAGHADTYELRQRVISSVVFTRGNTLNREGRFLEQWCREPAVPGS